jgi:uncharacterized radical SAM protein YgiQ
MGESTLLEIARRLDAGEDITALRDMRGVAYMLGKNEELANHAFGEGKMSRDVLELPSFEEVRNDARAFSMMTRSFHAETNPHNARRLTQMHGDRMLVINPPALPLTEAEMDAVHDLPYTRRAHPMYQEKIPAWETIKHSVQIMRGCFGGCTFCSITMHQGRTIQSRSEKSILSELRGLAADPEFKGHISDLGGPTANMYRMRCSKPKVEAICRRLSCVHPTVCKLLSTDHAPLVDLMQKSRSVEGVKKVHIASGIRMDLARDEPKYLNELARHHIGGHLKVAPEHVSESVLKLMKKPAQHTFEEFAQRFEQASKRAGKEQYLVPYFISSHPGSTEEDMIELAVFLKQRGYRPRQVQDFIPAPMDIATSIYYTGLDPFSMKPVSTAWRLKDREAQRALLQFFKPENYFAVYKALKRAGRADLIGDGPQCLISERPPPEALAARARGTKRRERPRGKTEQSEGNSPSSPGYRRPSRERGSRRRP